MGQTGACNSLPYILCARGGEFVTRSLDEFMAGIARQHAALNGIDWRVRR
ncbi:MAG: hypothetical protein QCH35_06320 [Methanomicrobiaceae archaeon]|nr:hypothetical protein [Methanomicrobiaceae archaeon]